MNKITLTLTLLIGFYMNAMAGNQANYEVVPLPQSIIMQKGAPFVIEEGVQILAPAELKNEADFLAQYLKEITNNDLKVRLVIRGIDCFKRVCIEQVKIRGEKSSPATEPVFARFAVAIPAIGIVCHVMNIFGDVDWAIA